MCAVTGGYVYRGKRYPRCAAGMSSPTTAPGEIMLLNSAGKRARDPRSPWTRSSSISAFGEDADGELYMVDYGPGNTLYRITG